LKQSEHRTPINREQASKIEVRGKPIEDEDENEEEIKRI
jgi:hypothetical protein